MQTVEYQPTSIPRSLTASCQRTVLACVTALAVLVTFILSFINADYYPIMGLPTYLALTVKHDRTGRQQKYVRQFYI
eukprot:m.95196 g.95196  ORF g.95196 m.95196 type:complete len:77 (+) comp36836_c0_seq6:93-323(+)